MKKKIFIIDDDRDMVESVSMVLEAHDYEVQSATAATDAVKKVKSAKPDLVILDVMFPENPSEGFDIARALSADKVTRNIPVIVLSAINERFKLGFSDNDRDETWFPVARFLEKPVEPAKLVKLVQELIPG
ncbi:MAG: response regulator [candidate division NC10 bacterium]